MVSFSTTKPEALHLFCFILFAFVLTLQEPGKVARNLSKKNSFLFSFCFFSFGMEKPYYHQGRPSWPDCRMAQCIVKRVTACSPLARMRISGCNGHSSSNTGKGIRRLGLWNIEEKKKKKNLNRLADRPTEWWTFGCSKLVVARQASSSHSCLLLS